MSSFLSCNNLNLKLNVGLFFKVIQTTITCSPLIMHLLHTIIVSNDKEWYM